MAGFTYDGAEYDGAEYGGDVVPSVSDGFEYDGARWDGDTYDYSIHRFDASVQTLTLNAQPAGISGTGTATLGATAQTLTLTPEPQSIAATGTATLDSPVQSLSLQSPTATISGTGTVTLNAAVQLLELTTPAPKFGFLSWVVNNEDISVTGVEITPTELRLDVRARDADVRSTLETLDSNAGAFSERELADGTLQYRDTAAGSNTYTVYPPYYMKPPRITRDWLVDNVSRVRTSADTQATEATLTFVPSSSRTDSVSYSDPADSDKWEFDFGSFGQIVTDSVANIDQGETTAIELILDPSQTELIESVATAIAGAFTFEVPDGETFTRDETPSERQTVTITPPSGASDPAIPSGTYVVTEWNSRGADGGGFRVTLQISTRYND